MGLGCIVGTTDAVSDCVNSCFGEVISSQPDSLRLFVRVVIGFWAPICELMVKSWGAWWAGVSVERVVVGGWGVGGCVV